MYVTVRMTTPTSASVLSHIFFDCLKLVTLALRVKMVEEEEENE